MTVTDRDTIQHTILQASNKDIWILKNIYVTYYILCATGPFSASFTIYIAPPALGIGADGSLDLAPSNTTVPAAVLRY